MINSADILQGNILIVDDQEANVALLKEMLSDAGYVAITSTRDPRAVCELHRQHHYDLILLDLQMPDLDGFQVMEGLKEIEPGGPLSILAITAQPGHKLRALKTGANDFISKPFDLPEILIRVHNLIEIRLVHLDETRNHARLENSQRIAGVGDWEHDFADGRLFWSEEVYRILGLSRKDCPPDAEAFYRHVHPDDLAFVRQEKKAALAGSRGIDFEHRIVRPDGEVRHVRQITELTFDDHGRPSRESGTMQDITERKLSVGALRRSEERFKFVARAVSDAVWDWDLPANTLWWNDGFLTTFGFAAAEIEPSVESWTGRIHPDDRSRVVDGIQQAIATREETWKAEYRFQRKDGSHAFVRDCAYILRDAAGKGVRLVGGMRDITARKQAEEEVLRAKEAAEAATRAKSDFLAIMSHEIRTPLNGVIGMSNLLAETVLDLKQRRYAGAIQSSASLLLTLINDILDFSKIEARCLTFEVLDFDLRQTVQDTLESLEERGRAKHLRLTGTIADDVPAWLRGDPGRLRQILTNLVNNSIKFTEKGEVAVHVSKCGETDATVDLRFTVRDTGIGISAEAQTRLFQAFSQANTSTTRKYGGTGLGLAISRQLVEMMHGEIGVISEAGQGATFHFRVRLDKQTESTGNPFERPAAFATSSVLVVTSDPANRELVAEKLRAWGLRVETVGGSVEALGALRASRASDRPFTLAIIAAELPLMDGLALAAAIANDAAIAGTRTVLLASVERKLDEAALQTARVSGVVTLPLRPALLFKCISHALADEAIPGSSTGSPARTARTVVNRPGPVARILVAEDNVINQEVALEYLEKLGYRAEVVANGLEAVEELGRIPYDLVFMDCMMPEMDGYAAAIRIRELEATRAPGFGDRPPVHIVAMTANAMAGDREKCLAAGMNDYVPKPVSAVDLRRAIMRWSAKAATDGVDCAPSVDAVAAPPVDLRPDAPPVNLRRMGDVVSQQPAKLRRMIGLYIEQADEMHGRLRAAVGSGAVATIRQVAHRWGGSSSTFGIVAVVPPLAQLERMAIAGQIDDAATVFGETERQWQRARDFLQAHLQTLPPLNPIESHDQAATR